MMRGVWSWNYNYILSIRYADQVSAGDEVMVLGNDKLMPSKVVDVSSHFMQGNCSNFPFPIFGL